MSDITLEEKIAYKFKDSSLLSLSMCHKSYANEKQKRPDAYFVGEHNERLEFLGDAVLQLVISDLLWDKFPTINEGKLSKIRSSLVNQARLATVARNMQLGGHIQLGKGEINTDGRNKESILSCAYEALLGAIYLDGGLAEVHRIIEEQFEYLLLKVKDKDFFSDFKSQLQEKIQAKFRKSPAYCIVKEEGPEHLKSFEIGVSVGSLNATGIGKNKKEAEQNAAKALLSILEASEQAASPSPNV